MDRRQCTSARESHYYPFRYSDEIKQRYRSLQKNFWRNVIRLFNKEAKAAETTAGMPEE